jgi:hypothetical protein
MQCRRNERSLQRVFQSLPFVLNKNVMLNDGGLDVSPCGQFILCCTGDVAQRAFDAAFHTGDIIKSEPIDSALGGVIGLPTLAYGIVGHGQRNRYLNQIVTICSLKEPCSPSSHITGEDDAELLFTESVAEVWIVYGTKQGDVVVCQPKY